MNVHVFDRDEGIIYPYAKSAKSISEVRHSIDLLLLDIGDTPHYVLIRKLHLLAPRGKQDKKEEQEGKIKESRYTLSCSNCYASLTSRAALANHEKKCQKAGQQTFSLPKQGSTKYFKDIYKRTPIDIIGAFDFETRMSSEMSGKSSTESIILEEQMIASVFSIIFSDRTGKILFERTYGSDTDCLSSFFDALFDAKQVLLPLLERYPRHNLSPEEAAREKEAAKMCYLCGEAFPFDTCAEKEIFAQCTAKKGAEMDEALLAYAEEMQESQEGNQKKKHPLSLCRCIDHSHYSSAFLGSEKKSQKTFFLFCSSLQMFFFPFL